MSNIDPGATVAVYLVDVDGDTLGISIYRAEEDDPGLAAALDVEVDDIIASLQIEP